MLYIVFLLVGIGIGIIFTTLMKRTKSVGVLRIDNSDPSEDPYLFLELTRDPHELYNAKFVNLEVKVKNFISQK